MLPFEDFDVSRVNRIEDLPVWKTGCDSSYSWSKKFKHLNHSGTAAEIAALLMDELRTRENPQGTFLHDASGMETHMCFTGGEPLLPVNQRSIIKILAELETKPGGLIPGTRHRKQNNFPRYITFETNGTQELLPEFVQFFKSRDTFVRVFFSVSPKLFTVAGEPNTKAIKPETVRSYQKAFNSKGQLKFVLGQDKIQWNELDRVLAEFRAAGVTYPTWIMPTGATEEDQHEIAATVSDMALEKGYNVSARVHAYIYKNLIGK